MGVNCCDICPGAMVSWCHEGMGSIENYWQKIWDLGIDGLAPCDHENEDRWMDAIRKWREDMRRYFVRNQVVQE